LHGDIDRTNIIVRPDNTVAFVDFEKAKMFADGETLMREMAALPAILAEGSQE
jgi:RIO-like serine/threonine protein kinase